ncbi:MAG: IS21 family transposase, partial [bacterium]
MLQIRKCLVLLHKGRSIREINRLTGAHRKTIHNVLQRLKASALSAEQALALPDDKLSGILHPPKHVQTPDERYAELSQRLAHYARELNRRHVTKLILWEEYLQECPHGYRYSQFCRHLEQHIQRHSPTMPQIHRPGDKIQIDFAGDSLGYIDPVGKQWVESPVLVCTLPYSAFFYAEPLASTRQEHLIPALNNMLKALGGVPRNILSDNMSQVVTKPSRYEPVFTELMEHWTTHYRTNLQATRSGKPKDKPSVEKSVHIAYQQIYARMRNERHTSLKSLKHRFSELLDKVNDRVMASYGQSRFERFQELEKPCLGPLPEQAFPYKHRTLAKVKKNYHVILGEDWHQYSVPHQHIGKRVALLYDEHVVEIFLDYERIAVHKRKVIRNGYSTLEEHMPESHRRHKHQPHDVATAGGTR